MITNDDKWWLIRVWVLNLGHLNSCIVFYPQPSWVLLFQPMVGAAIHRSLPPVVFFVWSTVSTPTVDPPKLSGELRADTPNAHEPWRWFHNDTWKKKRPRLFLLVKLQNWPMAAKELQPPATNLPRFITEHCHWNLCCQQHDHKKGRKWVNQHKSPHDRRLFSQCWAIPFRLWGLRIGSLDLDSLKWHLHFC